VSIFPITAHIFFIQRKKEMMSEKLTRGEVTAAIEVALEEHKHDVGAMLDDGKITGDTAELMEMKVLEALDVIVEELEL